MVWTYFLVVSSEIHLEGKNAILLLLWVREGRSEWGAWLYSQPTTHHQTFTNLFLYYGTGWQLCSLVIRTFIFTSQYNHYSFIFLLVLYINNYKISYSVGCTAFFFRSLTGDSWQPRLDSWNLPETRESSCVLCRPDIIQGPLDLLSCVNLKKTGINPERPYGIPIW